MAYVYQINSDKGKEIAGSLGVGKSTTVSDGSTWTKNSDGSISVTTKSGNTYASNYKAPQNSSGGGYWGDSTSSSSSTSTNPATQTTNRYNTTITTPTGQKVQGYIENGTTYTNDGKRIGNGYSVVDAQGRTWTMQNGQGVLNNNAQNAYIQKYGTGTYAGPQKFVHDGMNIDMATDYEALKQQYKDNPQVQKILEEARNAKINHLIEYGITDYSPTNEYGNVSLVDTSAMDRAYRQYAAAQRGLQSGEINAANAAANADLAALDAQRGQLNDAYASDLRQLWIDSQLDLRTLDELLAARGISGGNAETAQLDIASAYQSGYGNRAREYGGQLNEIANREINIRNNLAQNVAAIEGTYGPAIANAYADLVQQRAAAESEARANIIASLGL